MDHPPERSAAPRPSPIQLVEYATVAGIAAAAALFTIGKVELSYELRELDVHGLHLDVPWQDHVFSGGLTLINAPVTEVFSHRNSALVWMLALVVLGGFAALRARLRRVGRARWAQTTSLVLMVICGLTVLLGLAVDWGKYLGRNARDAQAFSDRLVFQPGIEATLPAALVDENRAGTLYLLMRTEDSLVLLSKTEGRVFQVASSSVLLVETDATKSH